jgi:hypothetical protein
MSGEIIQSDVAYENYDDFQHVDVMSKLLLKNC